MLCMGRHRNAVVVVDGGLLGIRIAMANAAKKRHPFGTAIGVVVAIAIGMLIRRGRIAPSALTSS
jgi:hypothetical protein